MLRRDGDPRVLFVPAVYPRATEIEIDGEADDWHSWTRDCATGSTVRAPRRSTSSCAACRERRVVGAVQRHAAPVEAEAVDGGVRVRVTFGDGPCALLVWGSGGAGVAAASSGDATTLDGPWEVELVRTLEDDWGDLAPPAADVETWELEHRMDGAEWALGARDVRPARLVACGDGMWRPAEWSPSRGIFKDPVHIEYLGGSGRVPEEFLDFGAGGGRRGGARAGGDRSARGAAATHLAVGAYAAKRAWLDGREVELYGRGYLCRGPVCSSGRDGARAAR